MLKKNLQLKIPQERFDDRRRLLAELDTVKRQMDKSGVMDGMDRFQQQAFDVIIRGVAEAFDLSKEDPKTIAQYDTSKLFRTRRHHEVVRHAPRPPTCWASRCCWPGGCARRAAAS